MVDKTTEQEDEIVLVELDSKGNKIVEEAEKEPEKEKEPESHDDDQDDDDEDERLAESQDDSDEDVVNPNRVRRQKRRQARRAYQERTERELEQLRQQVVQLTQKLTGVEGTTIGQSIRSLENEIAAAEQDASQAELILAKAIEAQNGTDASLALKFRDEAIARAAQLKQAKQQTEQAREQINRPQPQEVDPRVKSYAEQWMSANTWYNPKGGDEDSLITNAIDAALTREGYDPRSADYWKELTKRVSEKIGEQKPNKRKAPPVGGVSREQPSTSNRKEVYVTPERKQAMIDAGAWDDPEKRAKMLKAYRAYDENNSAR